MKTKTATNIVFAAVIAALLAGGAYYGLNPIKSVYTSYVASKAYDEGKAGTDSTPKGKAKRLARYAKKNKDTLYILTVPGTEIDYPVVSAQRKGNQFYLHANIKGESEFSGTLFVDKRTPPGSALQVVHGHNMESGTLMFHDLRHYAKKKWAKKHRRLVLTTASGTDYYRLACVALAHGDQQKFAYISPDFGGDLAAYNRELEARAVYSAAKKGRPILSPSDEVIALSTCVYDFKDARMVCYFTKLKKDGEIKKAASEPVVVARSFARTVDAAMQGCIGLAGAVFAVRLALWLKRRRRSHYAEEEGGHYGQQQ